MNSEIQSLKDKIRRKAFEKNVDFNIIMLLYVYDRFIARISKSAYQNNFVLKGGFYLSALFGLDKRTTLDIDTCLRNADLNEKNIRKMITGIIKVDLSDNINFEIDRIEAIREEDEYGGYRVYLCYYLGKETGKIHIDIATGDPIYPEALKYTHINFVTGEKCKIFAYNIETVLAEKIETILRLGELSGRMKDYYDVYIINKLAKKEINIDTLKGATKQTFAKRNFDLSSNNSMYTIKSSEILKIRWSSYIKSNSYAKDVAYEDTIKCLEEFIDLLV